MNCVLKRNRKKDAGSGEEWFRESFADEYLWLYAHRSDAEAVEQVKTAVRLVPFEREQKVLDVACGTGRHMLALARRGARMTGVDLSKTLLAAARRKFKESGMQASFVHRDMRALDYKEQFDGAMMWFTSFGYFPKKIDDRRVLQGISDSIRPGGWWWIDLPNPIWLEDNLVKESHRTVVGPRGKADVFENRRIHKGRVQKIMRIVDASGEKKLAEDVRLYYPEEFGNLIKRSGLQSTGIIGDYDGSALTSANPRQIWFGSKK